ncbi:MAG: hypothetical protein J7K73_01070 [Nanoarchaeota archaeon]|nr:hypothetical protein [Nanoarchaeota archaeon]
MNSRKYIVLGAVLIFLFFLLVTLNKIEAPLEEIAKLPKCKNGVVISDGFKSKIVKFANDYIRGGTGDDYFNAHYHFLNLEYSTTDCVFVARYDFTYNTTHEIMNLKIKAFSEKNFEVIYTHAFLRPVEVVVGEDEAKRLAQFNDVDYDYVNLEVDVDAQTFVYRFYKNTITEGPVVVFEVDAQSKEVRVISGLPEEIPIV